MKKNKSYLISLAPEIIPLLKIPALLKIDKIEDSYFMFCSDINEESPYFFKIIISKDHQNNATGHEFELLLPYHYVLYVFCASSTDLNKTLGFRGNLKDDDSQS